MNEKLRILDIIQPEQSIYLLINPFDGQPLDKIFEAMDQAYSESEIIDLGAHLCDLVDCLHGS